MNLIFSILTICSLIFPGFIMASKNAGFQPSKASQLVNSILSKASKIIHTKYHLRPSGVGVSMPGGPIRELTLCFDTEKQLTKEELRILLINSANELLDEVNKSPEIQQFIKTPPFTIKNIEIIIYNHDKKTYDVFDPGIAVAKISRGILNFKTVDINNTFDFKNRYEETYEEALAILNQSK